MRFPLLFIGFGTALLLASAGCGQRGPLYLRESPPPGMKPPKAETYKPVPYPRGTDTDLPAR